MSLFLLLWKGASVGIAPTSPEIVLKKNKELLLDKDFDLVYRLGFTRLDCWNTAGRPLNPKELVAGFNIETNLIEVSSGGTWYVTGSGGSSSGKSYNTESFTITRSSGIVTAIAKSTRTISITRGDDRISSWTDGTNTWTVSYDNYNRISGITVS